MQPSPTELHLPPHFPFPIKITSLDTQISHDVTRGTRLLSYSFVYLSNSPGAQPETRFGTWDSSLEGSLSAWKIKPGDVISRRHAREKPVAVILEPCKHGMQLGGLCVVCGKDMTNIDYTGFSDASRASIQMTHSAFGPTVSLEEAQRIERETAEHLLKSRKLSLIVDLDQTIVHATVDPTVGEWIAEGESWEQQRTSQDKEDGESDDSSSSDMGECLNPNWEALKDVKKFRLGPESFGLPTHQGKRRPVENEGCMYYIKPRPGWREFFEDAATKYEMHVYTMGTRAYAEQVCAAIDPDGKLFGGRLLSRDESGSLTQKSLRRLFPCDTSMVVIIDDRADVWEWSPNLIKVIPYDFFIGIGDINSSFLPKLESITAGSLAQPLEEKPASPKTTLDSATTPVPSGAEEAEAATNAMIRENNIVLELQVEERPLAKKQTELLQAAEQPLPILIDQSQQQVQAKPAGEPLQDNRERKALLKNDDQELGRVSKFLGEVHKRFYTAYDTRHRDEDHRRRRKIVHDVTKIIPHIRSEALAGVYILFSAVIPVDTRAETTELWRMAYMFGAKCSTELSSEVTHVVSAKSGTAKVDAARERGGIKIVWLSWFTDSVALWQRQDETPYLLDELSMSTATIITSPTTSSQQISSDTDPDMESPGTLELAELDWNDINDEVEAAMNESDEDGEGEGAFKKLLMVSEDEWTDESNSVLSERAPTPTMKRKRSVTPSGTQSVKERSLRSPLAKRKKLAAERTGYSRLKQGITADELEQTRDSEMKGPTTLGMPAQDEAGEDGDDEEEEEEEEDDFLARELEEEWG